MVSTTADTGIAPSHPCARNSRSWTGCSLEEATGCL
jgi:hypothetical protein